MTFVAIGALRVNTILIFSDNSEHTEHYESSATNVHLCLQLSFETWCVFHEKYPKITHLCPFDFLMVSPSLKVLDKT